MTNFPAYTISGYPRIGANRELKKSLEAYWANKIDRPTFDAQIDAQVKARIAHLSELGLDATSSQPADFVLYDQVLTLTCALGAVPQRFGNLVARDGSLDVDGQFTLARGVDDKAALEMTKWFDTNYHYLVPEIGPYTKLAAVENPWLKQVRAAGNAARPVLVGPVTYLLGAKPTADAPDNYQPLNRLQDVLGAFATLLSELAAAGVQWVQLDEPGLVRDTWNVPRDEVLAGARQAYAFLGGLEDRPALFVNAPYGDLGSDGREVLGAAPVEAVGFDLVAGAVPARPELALFADKTVVAGVVSGRNIWRTDLGAALEVLRQIRQVCPQVSVSTSTSLQHVPYDVTVEENLPADVRSWLAFADQKITEVEILARGLNDPDSVREELAENARILQTRREHPGVKRAEVRQATAALGAADRQRAPYAQRAAAQAAELGLPLLPTTTIGSFPQTTEIRQARAAHRQGQINDAKYREEIKAEIKRVVELQEELGLDVLVHGEAERNDMVQYFAELLDGFATTEHGWVQSYGSRCTRPSILWGDVARPRPMTVEWSAYAQSLTAQPMKGMLTGPVTIMAWSFVRDDESKREVADQIGLALRQEIADLEAAGIKVIQVDEPAIRELLPLRGAGREEYLDWSVGSFRLATGGAQTSTQIHTHLCYSEFNVVVDAIDHLDADVTSIEASRSKMDILPAVHEHGFERGLGPGIWDIHSPRVPKLDEEETLLRAAVSALDPQQVWVNPDCGLKTRAYPETVATLKNLVAAAHTVRAEILAEN